MKQPVIFVPYHIALLAKQKGFDEPCLTIFSDTKLLATMDNNDNHSFQEREPFMADIPDEEWFKNTDSDDKGYCAAPTYQQLVDWLREKHSIHITVHPHTLYGSEYYGAVLKLSEDCCDYPVKSNYYEAFDYTLERVLKEL